MCRCVTRADWAMALIEGVGDEVTLLFASMLLLLVLLLAWISTRTSESPEHLLPSTTGPSPSLRSSPAQQDTPPSTTNTSSSSSSGSVSDSSLTEVPPTNTSTQEDKEGGEGLGGGERGGDGLRSNGGGGGGGAEPSSSQRNMVVRLKFLNDTERTAQVQPQDTIGYIKRSVHTVHAVLNSTTQYYTQCTTHSTHSTTQYYTQYYTQCTTHSTPQIQNRTLLPWFPGHRWINLLTPEWVRPGSHLCPLVFQDLLCGSGAAGPVDLSGSAAAG